MVTWGIYFVPFSSRKCFLHYQFGPVQYTLKGWLFVLRMLNACVMFLHHLYKNACSMQTVPKRLIEIISLYVNLSLTQNEFCLQKRESKVIEWSNYVFVGLVEICLAIMPSKSLRMQDKISNQSNYTFYLSRNVIPIPNSHCG